MTRSAHLHADIRMLAARQHGVVSRDQILEMGSSSDAVRRLRSSIEWIPGSRRVLRLSGSPPTDAQRMMAAVLDAGTGAFLSGPSAAAWWEVAGFSLAPSWPIHVTRRRGHTRRPSDLARIHEVLDLLPHHVTRLHDVPVSVPSRVIFELAATQPRQKVERACDNALTMRITTTRLLRQMLDEWADRGRGGTAMMREILEERPLEYVPPASNLERRFIDLTEGISLGPYRRQVDLGDHDWIGRVDFKHLKLPVVVELLSERYHSGLLDQEADRKRFEELRAAGFEVVTIWDHEAWYAPGEALDRLRAAELAARRRAA